MSKLRVFQFKDFKTEGISHRQAYKQYKAYLSNLAEDVKVKRGRPVEEIMNEEVKRIIRLSSGTTCISQLMKDTLMGYKRLKRIQKGMV